VYGASKAFVSSFGQALADEVAGTGVTCTTVVPGYTRTNFFERAGLAPDVAERQWMTAQDVARAAIEGARRGDPLVVPGSMNRWKMAFATPFPSLAAGRAKQSARRARDLVWRAKERVLR
jgi:hypothetical protein